SAAPTSGGTLGLVASSPNGSPGARARIRNNTRLMPSRLGTAIRSRRKRYRAIPGTTPSHSCFAVPVPQIPQHVVPPAEPCSELARQAADNRSVNDRDHRRGADYQIIHCDEQRCALGRIELAFRGAERVVVCFAAPARDVAALPFVVFAGDFPRQKLSHKI